ncbi:riboflavin synthase [Eupransor demetentiae]|uniref:Riboflavin synthase n=1 Tax=Eupransor demetentiae TaxID=3109584 RepID=A0ABM9N485_9LACO|nr:Riboflavin synthase alpha chain (RibC) [Lactobacillaceae bacterium LMG 33000]
MFTGIVQAQGKVKGIEERGKAELRLTIEPVQWAKQAFILGESIMVDGVCLTLADYHDDLLDFDVMVSTYEQTILADYTLGQMVNLEAALTLQQGLDGHLVLGHVDGKAQLEKIDIQGETHFYTFRFDNPTWGKEIVAKGSVAINGVSLTIVSTNESHFVLALVNFTRDHTNLSQLKAGDWVNLETDILAKYVQGGLQDVGTK